jgi:hypothetical protein
LNPNVFIMVSTTALPTFLYKKVVGARTCSGTQRSTTNHATCTYNNKTTPVRPIYKNVIDRRKWKGKPAPKHWPSHLKWPNDVFKSRPIQQTPYLQVNNNQDTHR